MARGSGVATHDSRRRGSRKGVIMMSEDVSDRASMSVTWDVLVEGYRHAAVEALARHLRTGSRCAECGQPWPCTAACAAEAALEL
ncbi:MAG TPA: hypothetical protein VJT49_12665 [Amycolatopsis sp.]|uniref:hypothetical protein n=1 Tax=Amycolatopsis sp. TaxID=37632 RepID=UPI002B487A87|nr:hypothetical protein [Amycolatopsis sp.]HKS45940.1 hypothetical protein [Amycolatopsis sp.]